MGDVNKSTNELYYADYLHLKSLLDAQQPESTRHGRTAHDEMLFIITHQTYELWFKQILHELRSVSSLFAIVPLDEKRLNTIVARLQRIVCIQKVINQHIGILETMTPLDFLDFRDYLTPASGFQSVQFREIELRLGLSHGLQAAAYRRFSDEDRHYLEDISTQRSLFDDLEAWLARTPFLEGRDFNFWKSYRSAVEKMLSSDQETIVNNRLLNDAEKTKQLKELDNTRQSFACLFDAQLYGQYQAQGRFYLSHPATLAALFIRLYGEEPLLQLPFKFLDCLKDIDEQLTGWRAGHAMMVQRMVGRKIGTGGSSGHDYLESTISRKRIFADLFNLSTFLIPRSELPPLPDSVRRNLGFYNARH